MECNCKLLLHPIYTVPRQSGQLCPKQGFVLREPELSGCLVTSLCPFPASSFCPCLLSHPSLMLREDLESSNYMRAECREDDLLALQYSPHFFSVYQKSCCKLWIVGHQSGSPGSAEGCQRTHPTSSSLPPTDTHSSFLHFCTLNPSPPHPIQYFWLSRWHSPFFLSWNCPKGDQLPQMGSIARFCSSPQSWCEEGVVVCSALLCPLQSPPLTLDPTPSIVLPDYLEIKCTATNTGLGA